MTTARFSTQIIPFKITQSDRISAGRVGVYGAVRGADGEVTGPLLIEVTDCSYLMFY